MAPRVLVADDDPAIRSTVSRVLRAGGYNVEAVGDGAELLRRAVEEPPDLVVLDLMMPGLDGIEVCDRLRQTSRVPVLMLTARATTDDRVRGLDHGADDYLVKPFAYQELQARARALLRRTPPAAAERLLFADLSLDVAERRAQRAGRPLALTAREFDLLAHMMRNPRRVFGRERLLDAIWPDGVESDNVVAVYVGYLRAKLEADGGSRLIQTVRGAGYSLREA